MIWPSSNFRSVLATVLTLKLLRSAAMPRIMIFAPAATALARLLVMVIVLAASDATVFHSHVPSVHWYATTSFAAATLPAVSFGATVQMTSFCAAAAPALVVFRELPGNAAASSAYMNCSRGQ